MTITSRASSHRLEQHPPRGDGLSPSWYALVLVSVAASGSVILLSPRPAVALAGAIAWLAVPWMALPFMSLRGVVPIAHPWTVVFLLFLHGWVIRLTLSAFSTEPGGAFDVMFMGASPDIVPRGFSWGMAGIAAFAVGYFFLILRGQQDQDPSTPPRRFTRWNRLDRVESWRPARLDLACLIVLAASVFGLYMLLRSGEGTFVGKRFNEIEGGSAQRTGSVSYVYLRLSYLAHSVFVVLLICRLKFGRLPTVITRLLLPIAAVGAVLGPLMSDSRAGVALVVLDTVLISAAVQGRVRIGRTAVIGVITAGLLAWMLALRSNVSGLGNSVLAIFTGRDLFDFGKTAHITALDGGVLEGQTLYGWMVFPLPESMFAEKPMWSELGPYVWTVAYGASGVNGVPAGLIGELYLNLGTLGVLLGMLVFGMLIGAMYKTLVPGLRHRQVFCVAVFAIGIVRLVMFGLSNDLGTGVLSSLTDLLPILAILAFVAPSRVSADRDGSGSARNPAARRAAQPPRRAGVSRGG